MVIRAADNVAKELQTETAWVNDMKSELLPVEAIEKQVREAITFPESQNSRLQSTANEENSALQSSA